MFEKFQNIYPAIANRLNITRQIDAAFICEMAKRIITSDFPELAPDIHIRCHKNKKLYLRITNPSASNDFFYKKKGFLDKLNSTLGSKAVEDVVTR